MQGRRPARMVLEGQARSSTAIRRSRLLKLAFRHCFVGRGSDHQVVCSLPPLPEPAACARCPSRASTCPAHLLPPLPSALQHAQRAHHAPVPRDRDGCNDEHHHLQQCSSHTPSPAASSYPPAASRAAQAAWRMGGQCRCTVWRPAGRLLGSAAGARRSRCRHHPQGKAALNEARVPSPPVLAGGAF